MTLLQRVHKLWLTVPERLRARARGLPGARAAREALARSLPHDVLYDDSYFGGFEAEGAASASVIADSIVADWAPRTVLDVGCGTGLVLLALKRRGVAGRGLEYATPAIDACRRRNLIVDRFDIERDAPRLSERFDLVISLEVGEHLPAKIADRYVELLCAHSPTIVFSAATPGQGGEDHVNEQPHDYWIRRMAKRGFEVDRERSLRWREAWKAGGAASWYCGKSFDLRPFAAVHLPDGEAVTAAHANCAPRGQVAIITPGDVFDAGSYSGIPFGLRTALEGLGYGVTELPSRLPGRLDDALLALLGLGLLRMDDLRAPRPSYWQARMDARHLSTMSWARSRSLWLKRRRQTVRQPLAGVVLHGCEVELLGASVPCVTFEDSTLAQARRANLPYGHLARARSGTLKRWEQRHLRVYAKAVACCATSALAAASIRDDYGQAAAKVHVVGIGRNLEPQPNAAARDWNTPRFLWVGKEWERKNGRAVVEAFGSVHAQNPSAELHLVGDHPPLSAPGVVTHGILDPSLHRDQLDLAALFASATCFVMPSLWEPSAIAYAEAAAAGIASIATAAGGSETIVGEGGVMVDPRDPEALLAAMRRLARPEEAEALGHLALSRAHLFTWRAVAGRLLRALGLEREETFLSS